MDRACLQQVVDEFRRLFTVDRLSRALDTGSDEEVMLTAIQLRRHIAWCESQLVVLLGLAGASPHATIDTVKAQHAWKAR